jgi:hypothetical protein
MKRTTDIKIKKIKTTNEKVCSIWDQVEVLEMQKNAQSKISLVKTFDFIKEKVAYISFGFMSVSVALYIFFITSIIVFAVQERSYIFSAKQIQMGNINVLVQSEGEIKDELKKDLAKVENLALSNDVIYIKRVENVETTLSVR